jgi:hypothetical protein
MMFYNIMNVEPRFPPSFPPSVRSLLKGFLVKDPQVRRCTLQHSTLHSAQHSTLHSAQGLSRGFQGAFKGLSRGFQGAFKGLSRGFQGAFKGLSRGFQGAFKDAHRPSLLHRTLKAHCVHFMFYGF